MESSQGRLCVFSTLKIVLLPGCVFSPLFFPFYFILFFIPPSCACCFKRNSSTLQNHQPPFSMAIGSPVSLEESSSLRIPYPLHKKVSQISKISFSYFKIYPLHYLKKMIFQSKNLIFYFQKKTFKCKLLFLKNIPIFLFKT